MPHHFPEWFSLTVPLPQKHSCLHLEGIVLFCLSNGSFPGLSVSWILHAEHSLAIFEIKTVSGMTQIIILIFSFLVPWLWGPLWTRYAGNSWLNVKLGYGSKKLSRGCLFCLLWWHRGPYWCHPQHSHPCFILLLSPFILWGSQKDVETLLPFTIAGVAATSECSVTRWDRAVGWPCVRMCVLQFISKM